MDWGASGRRDTYRFTAVDPFSLDELFDVDCVPSSCGVTFGYYTDNKVQADVRMAEESYQRMRGNLIRIGHTVEMADGNSVTEVLGTFFIDSAEKDKATAGEFRECNCYSTMWRLSQSLLTADHVFHVGDSCSAGLSRLMEGGGSTVILGEGVASKTHTVDGRFPMLANRLECANEYAGWCGWQVGVDDYGRQTVNGYLPPADRAPSYRFEDGGNCTYLPKLRESYTGELVNEVLAVWSREKVPDPDDGFGLSGRAYVKLDSANPYSYERCGVRMTGALEFREPKSDADLLKAAQDYLDQHDAAIRYLEIEHVGIPHLRAGDTVLYTNASAGEYNVLCEITQMSIGSLGPLMLTKSKLKVVGA